MCGRGLYLKKSIFLWGLRREFEGCGDIVQVGGGGNDDGVHGRSLWRGRPGFFSASQPYQEYAE